MKSKQRKRRSRKLSPRFAGGYGEMIIKKHFYGKFRTEKSR